MQLQTWQVPCMEPEIVLGVQHRSLIFLHHDT